MAFGLAISPTLVSFSRLAGTEIMAVGFGMMAFGLAFYRKPIPAGIFAGLMLLSGPSSLQGILGMGLALLFGTILSRTKVLEPLSNDVQLVFNSRALLIGTLSALAVFLVVGTLFLLVPTGLGSLSSIVPTYLRGWITFSDTRISEIMVSLFIYNPVALIFGGLAIIKGWRHKNNVIQWMSLWA